MLAFSSNIVLPFMILTLGGDLGKPFWTMFHRFGGDVSSMTLFQSSVEAFLTAIR